MTLGRLIWLTLFAAACVFVILCFSYSQTYLEYGRLKAEMSHQHACFQAELDRAEELAPQLARYINLYAGGGDNYGSFAWRTLQAIRREPELAGRLARYRALMSRIAALEKKLAMDERAVMDDELQILFRELAFSRDRGERAMADFETANAAYEKLLQQPDMLYIWSRFLSPPRAYTREELEGGEGASGAGARGSASAPSAGPVQATRERPLAGAVISAPRKREPAPETPEKASGKPAKASQSGKTAQEPSKRETRPQNFNRAFEEGFN